MQVAGFSSGAARAVITLAALVVVIAGLRAASTIVVPFLLAVFIAILATPAFVGMRSKGVPSIIALLVLIAAIAGVAFLGGGLFASSVADFSKKLPDYRQQLSQQRDVVVEWLNEHEMEVGDPVLKNVLNPDAMVSLAGSAAASVSSMLANMFLIVLIAVFILLEAAILPAKVRSLPRMTDDTWLRLQRIVAEVRNYVGVKTILSLATGGLVAAGLAIIGVNYAIPLGVIAFLLNYVPNIGSIVAAIPGVLLALLDLGVGAALACAAVYLVINIVIGNIIEPRVMGRRMGLSPLVVLLSMIFWGWALGPAGMLLSVPLTMAVKIVLERAEETQWIAILLGPNPGAEPADAGDSSG